MTIDRSMIKAVVLALIVWFMRRDLVLALVIGLASYLLTTMVNL